MFSEDGLHMGISICVYIYVCVCVCVYRSFSTAQAVKNLPGKEETQEMWV